MEDVCILQVDLLLVLNMIGFCRHLGRLSRLEAKGQQVVG